MNLRLRSHVRSRSGQRSKFGVLTFWALGTRNIEPDGSNSDTMLSKAWLTRHCLGCFCTHHSLGGRIRPPVLCRKRMDVERRTRRHSKDLDETLPKHLRKFKIEVTCQVKVRSKVKIGCFQVADRSDLKGSIFGPKLSICTPKDQAKVLTSENVSYLAKVKVKVRSEKVTKPKIFK